MTKEEAAFLEAQKRRLLENYETGVIKQCSPYVRGSLRVAYVKGQNDILNMISEVGFRIERIEKDSDPLPLLEIKSVPATQEQGGPDVA